MSSSHSVAGGSSNSLKRSWSKQNGTGVPLLPKINGDIILEVFTHKSLHVVHVNEEYGNERLALLGGAFLEAAVTESLFRLKPTLKAGDITVSHSAAPTEVP
jgi:dsRNA-specific ribonuclease